MPDTTITSVGNAGFLLAQPDLAVVLDPFFGTRHSASAERWLATFAPHRLDLLLFTHDHWDHFNAAAAAELARRTDATVAGPSPVIEQARAAGAPPDALVTLDPVTPAPGQTAPALTATVRGVTLTAYRTPHGRIHNSYRLDLPGCRCFHDGDNENTRVLDPGSLQRLDVLFLATWLGAAWVEFVEATRPRHWLIMHMSLEELDALDRHEYFRDLCDRVPQPPVGLRPGHSYTLPA